MFYFYLSRLIFVVIIFTFILLGKKNTNTLNQYRLNYDKGLRKFCVRFSEYFIHFLMTHSQSFLWRMRQTSWRKYQWASSSDCFGVPQQDSLPVFSSKAAYQALSSEYLMFMRMFWIFLHLRICWMLILLLKNLRLTRDRPNIHLAQQSGYDHLREESFLSRLFWSLYILPTDRLVIISLTNLWTCLFFTQGSDFPNPL